MDGTILVADDDRTIRTVLTQALTRAGCRVHATSSLVMLMRWVEEGKGDLVISDVMMPDGNGLEMLPRISAVRPDLPVIIISAQNTLTTAIQATEADAFDYLPKPFDLPDLMKRAARALAMPRRRKADSAPVASDETSQELPLVGRTPAMQELYRQIAQVMNADLPVLVLGDSGTGKSVIARTLHDFSDRRSLPFVTGTCVDFASLDGATALLSKARGGSIVIEELTDFDADAQMRLLRCLDIMAEPAPRIIVTSRRSLPDALADGSLREDLYYRVSGASLFVPALRDRIDDLGLLVEHFSARNVRMGADNVTFHTDALKLMRHYRWPGNVRQLENVIAQLCIMAGPDGIKDVDVTHTLMAQPASDDLLAKGEADQLSASVESHLRRYFDQMGGNLPPPGLYQRILKEIEAPLLRLALEATNGNQAKCADILGINRNTLRKKLTDLDIRVTRSRRLM